MQTPSSYTVQYAPGPVPSNAADYPRYLQQEFQKIAAAIALLAEGNYTPSYAPPAKLRPGLVRYADGVSWNPTGAGEGIYFMTSDGNWSQMG